MDDEQEVIVAICKYVYSNWISKAKSQRDFAAICDIEESTVRRIKNIALGTSKTNYNISVKTIAKICRKNNVTLTELFQNIKK